MPTLATGTSISSGAHATARARGFTLIEIMVVVVIIGVITAVFIVTFTNGRHDEQLEREAQKLEALFDYVREQAELQHVRRALYLVGLLALVAERRDEDRDQKGDYHDDH